MYVDFFPTFFGVVREGKNGYKHPAVNRIKKLDLLSLKNLPALLIVQSLDEAGRISALSVHDNKTAKSTLH